MISLLITVKNVYGNFILQTVTSLVDPQLAGHLKLTTEPAEHSLSSWILGASTMTVGMFLAFVAFLLIIGSALYIPLPHHICDRQKIQLIEFMLRLTNEYLGDLVEIVFGTTARTNLSRFVVGFPYFFQKKPPKWVTIEDREIGGVKCRVYLPDASVKKNNGLIIFIHGGGWCLMKPNFYDGPMYMLMTKLGCTVVSVDYKLTPEVVFPSPILECEKVVKSVFEKVHQELKVDPTKISLMGDSAGGNLTATVCQRLLREGKGHYVKSQVMLYPVINVTDFQSPSYQYYDKAYNGTALLNRKVFARMVLGYVGIEPSAKNVQLINQNKHIPLHVRESKEYKALTDHSLLPENFRSKDVYEPPKAVQPDPCLSTKFAEFATNPDLNPLFGKDLHGLPEAMIVTTGVDILRDEGILYGKRLESFNVPVKWFHYDRAFHGILNMPKSKQRRRIIEDVAAFLESKM